jgi:opacity protein-like surface antigen
MSGRLFLKTGIAAALLAVAIPVAAQGPQGPPRGQRGYLIGFGGAAATEITSPYFGGAVGVNVTPDLQLFAEISRTQDLQPNFLRQDLTTANTAGSAELGGPLVMTAKVPTNFYTGGIRYLVPLNGPARPYIAASGGVAHMSPEPRILALGLDLTSQMVSEQPFQSAFRENTRPMASIGGGVAVTVGRYVTFDIGYKFSSIFIQTDYLQDLATSPDSHKRIDTHRAYAGLGFAF